MLQNHMQENPTLSVTLADVKLCFYGRAGEFDAFAELGKNPLLVFYSQIDCGFRMQFQQYSKPPGINQRVTRFGCMFAV